MSAVDHARAQRKRYDAAQLSEAEARALFALVKHVYMTCAVLGAQLWGTKNLSNCSCPWARPAGAVIKKLKARGFVERHYVMGDHRTLYRATRAGEEHLKTNHDTRVAAGLEKSL